VDDLKNFCCLNPECADYGQRGQGNLRVCFRNGPNNARRVLACRTCQQRFSERKGTPLYRAKLAEDKALAVLQHLQESCGVRQTSRLVGVNKNTVVRLAVVAGQHAQQLHDDLVAFSPQDARSPVR
jgi:LacI family transcriptional regulator